MQKVMKSKIASSTKILLTQKVIVMWHFIQRHTLKITKILTIIPFKVLEKKLS